MGLPGAIKNKQFKKTFYDKKIFKLIKKSEFFHISRTNPRNRFNCPRIFKKSNKSGYIVTFHVLNNNFSYTQLAFAVVPQKDSYYIRDDTDACFFFRSFSLSLIIVGCHFLYIEKYFVKNIFTSFFYMLRH